ncbi:MAG: Peptidyl-tRNA hydrolase [Syntrophomonadaceae bacterium]|nr:Peptidyl-tRNA hydrolase [Bacillota bacterium]
MTVIILGLGNPGPRYQLTRHNIGFRVVDKLSAVLNIPLYQARYHAYYGQGQVDGRQVVLAKPLTYMNGSGLAAAALCQAFGVSPDRLLTVFDDLDLPPGAIRLRPRGGSGGHNGLKSLIFHLATEEFPRLRLGIGRPDVPSLAAYVLEAFLPEEACQMEEVLELAAEAALMFVREGIEAAMNRFNMKK